MSNISQMTIWFHRKTCKTLVQALKIVYFNWHRSLFSGLDKFVTSKWMLQQSPCLCCITCKYILVCPPLCWDVSSFFPLYSNCPCVRFSNKYFCAFFCVDSVLETCHKHLKNDLIKFKSLKFCLVLMPVKEMRKNVRLEMFCGCCSFYFPGFLVHLSAYIALSWCFVLQSLGSDCFVHLLPSTAESCLVIWVPTMWLSKALF